MYLLYGGFSYRCKYKVSLEPHYKITVMNDCFQRHQRQAEKAKDYSFTDSFFFIDNENLFAHHLVLTKVQEVINKKNGHKIK